MNQHGFLGQLQEKKLVSDLKAPSFEFIYKFVSCMKVYSLE